MKRLVLVALAVFNTPLFAGTPLVDQLGIKVVGPTRQFAYTNKQAGTYYGEVNGQNSGGWQGWYVNAEKIVDDYSLEADGRTLDRNSASSVVFPYQLIRSYPDSTDEYFTLLDSVNAFVVQVRRPGPGLGRVTMMLQLSESYEHVEGPAGIALWRRKIAPRDNSIPSWVGLESIDGSAWTTFIVVAASTKDEAVVLGETEASHAEIFIDSRKQRMENILQRSWVETENEDLNIALMWAKLSLDALIMNQSQSGVPVKGIFAGLPWFNDYWGRDSFISLPGATFVTGDFADARDILLSFARFQATDSSSTNFGRIPNIVTTTSLAYNTADGTPWFIKQVYDYVKYSGDTTILSILFPVVERSIEGTIKYHTDSLRFLTHGDAETWMDAVGPNGPWSPRGNRACDIQALWYDQLLIGSFIADYLAEYHLAARWKAIADSVEKNFNKYFVDRHRGIVYDHLQADGSPSRELRPNQLFCLDLLNAEDLRERVVKNVTASLIYPHGVGTLAATDSNFHPFHHDEPYYVQDAAYHNGIVWSWLYGRAVYALTRNDEEELTYELTKNMVHQILYRGCVGTLSELVDAMPRPEESEPRLSGTFSQAWSLAEFIRSFYQDYLGISVDATSHFIRVNPKLPRELGSVSFNIRVGDSHIKACYEVSGDSIRTSLIPERLGQKYAVSYLWVYRNGDAAFVNTSVAPAESLTIAHSLNACSVERNGSVNPYPNGSAPWFLKGFSSKGAFEGLKLAAPAFDPNFPTLRGPAFPVLTLEEIRRSNPYAKTLFDKTDSSGDDKGISGSYQYPANVSFRAGILDITHANVRFDSSNIYFALEFRNLTNPGWHPEYGFQLTFAAIAIHRGNGGIMDVGNNSHFVLDDAHRFDRLITVGGGIRLTDENGKVLCEYLPRAGDERNPIGNVARKSIEFSLPLKYLGKPTAHWKITILVGAQDDHGGAGVGEFREVDGSATEWSGGGKVRQIDPNVYDTLTLEP